jgi:carbon monoxide dehydrogenase subunit G
MELEVHRQERIVAPLQMVWDEMGSLEQVLAKSPQIAEYEVVPGGQRARGTAMLSWGPVKWTVQLEIGVTQYQPRERLGFLIEGPALEVRYDAVIDLAAIGDAETRLEYRGHLDVRHRMAARMRGLFGEIAEDQAHSLVHRVKVRAEQRRLAQERLLQ